MPAATINGRVFEDVNYGGGAGRALAASSGAGIPGVQIEVYAGNTYQTTITTGTGGTYSYNYSGNAARTLRVINGTVRSSRNTGCTTCVAVQTYRTTGSGNTATPVTNRVGGENPALTDAPANTSSVSLASLTTGTQVPQSIATFDPTNSSSIVADADFGFNFDTIVNTRDTANCAPTNSLYPCQGTLRQFIINSNALGGSLAQSGFGQIDGVSSLLPLGYETSIFMIPNGALTSGVAAITLADALPAIIDVNTRLDATTQTVNIGNTNPGSVGSGGTVGVLGSVFPQFARPEVQVAASGTGVAQIVLTASGQSIHGFALPRGSISMQGPNSGARNNLVGLRADGVGDSGGNMGIVFTGANALVRGNYVSVDNSGIRGNSPGAGAQVSYNEVIRSSGAPGNTFDGILIIGSASNVRIENNIARDQAGAGIEMGFESGTMTGVIISNNTVRNNGYLGGSPSAEPAGIAAWRYSGSNVEISLNRIENNAGPGLMMSNVTGTRITQNQFSNNGGLAIDLYSTDTDPNSMGPGAGPTLNDAGDVDSGANGLLNFPVITAATVVNGEFSLAGFARPGSAIELYVAQPDPSGFGEGFTYVTTLTEGSNDLDAGTGSYSGPVNGVNQGIDTTNRFLFRGTVPAGIAGGVVLTSTATLSGQTSEFGGNVTITTGPNLIQLKSVAAYSDPFNSTTNPKSIPGAFQLYTVRVTNQGAGVVDSNTMTIVDAVPANTTLYVRDIGVAGSGPIRFVNGTTSSNLTYTFTALNNTTDNLDFSTDGVNWGYTPVPDAQGCDPAVRYIRVRPQGTMAAAAGGNPYFEIEFRVRVN